MTVPKDGVNDFKPLTPIMPDEAEINAPRATLANAKRMLSIVEDLLPLGPAGLSNPEAALEKARQIVAQAQQDVDAIMDRLLHHPELP